MEFTDQQKDQIKVRASNMRVILNHFSLEELMGLEFVGHRRLTMKRGNIVVVYNLNNHQCRVSRELRVWDYKASLSEDEEILKMVINDIARRLEEEGL